ncbi:MAG: hypothetical protein LBK26_04015 [Rickettsiales bacterium]|jgi:hypothetical protein|nr:hypothetical protein [Rickettsiales bacterium]
MSNRKQRAKIKGQGYLFIGTLAATVFAFPAFAEMKVDIAPDAIPVFQQIAEMEQEKILLQLEKERAQLMLEMDRMAVEQARLRGDLESDKNAAALEKLEQANEKLESEKEALKDQIERLKASSGSVKETAVPQKKQNLEQDDSIDAGIAARYRLIDIVGAGRQLQATVEDLKTGQRKKVWAGRPIDEYEVRSVSLDDGVVFVKDGVSESLNVGGGKE